MSQQRLINTWILNFGKQLQQAGGGDEFDSEDLATWEWGANPCCCDFLHVAFTSHAHEVILLLYWPFVHHSCTQLCVPPHLDLAVLCQLPLTPRHMRFCSIQELPL